MTTSTTTAAPVRTQDNPIVQGAVIGLILTAGSYAVGLAFGWITEVNWLEAFAVFTSYMCTWLCVKQKRINYPIGALSTAAYCLLFIQQDLVASAILNAYLTPSLLYGWFRWRADTEARPVKHVQAKWLPVYALVTAAAYGGALLLVNAFGGQLAGLDAGILIGSVLAQFLLDNKKIETWIVWSAVNVLAIFVYFNAGLTLAGFQYIFFLLNAFVGYAQWKKTLV